MSNHAEQDLQTTSPAPTGVRQQALERIKKRRDFTSHLVAYVVVNGAVWALWALTDGGYPWPAWLSGIWAIGVVMNAWDVYARRPISEAEIRREMNRLRPQH
ncbi:MAG: 2TM domain-containing protein [Acidobacteriota bacterium]|nr:2TM domain-containing protein [Acidobacteriota bacterium]